MFAKNYKPEEVFTPRTSIINTEMFVPRKALEESLKKALRKSKHIIIFGESGCGKTWLYKKVLAENNCKLEIINAASISENGGISKALNYMAARMKPTENVGYEEKKHAELNVAISKGGLESTTKYEIQPEEPFLKLIKMINKKNRGEKTYLIFDNIEHIIKNTNLAKELSSLLLYLDDEEYSKNNVKIIIVGTLVNIREFLSSASDDQTIINRILELPEVSRLKLRQVEYFINKGFFELLNFTINDSLDDDDDEVMFLDRDFFGELIEYYTDGIPQYVQELCLEFSLNAEKYNNIIDSKIAKKSINDWISESLLSEYSRVGKSTNSSVTKHGRRNQCIYAMSKLLSIEFSKKEVEASLRANFPLSTKNKILNVSSILSSLVSKSSPIIILSPDRKSYRFISPKTKIMTRWMFKKLKDEELVIIKLD